MGIAEGTTVGTYYTEFLDESVAIAETNGGIANYNLSRSETMAITETNGGRFLWEIIDDTEVANWQNISNPQTPGWGAVDTTESPGWTQISTQ
jgi:hypothetical protein